MISELGFLQMKKGESEEVTCPGSLKINCDTAVARIHLSIGKKIVLIECLL